MYQWHVNVAATLILYLSAVVAALCMTDSGVLYVVGVVAATAAAFVPAFIICWLITTTQCFLNLNVNCRKR